MIWLINLIIIGCLQKKKTINIVFHLDLYFSLIFKQSLLDKTNVKELKIHIFEISIKHLIFHYMKKNYLELFLIIQGLVFKKS